MAFLDSLVKGFVRSAVNQVGKDGGKLISNKLYGGAHATPVANVSIGSYNRELYQDTAPLPTIGKLTYNLVMFSLWTLVLPNVLIHQMGNAAFFIPLLFIKRLWRPFFRSYVHPRVSKKIYKSDRRYTSGVRAVGSYMVTDKSIRVPLEPAEIKILRVEGTLKLIALLVSYIAMYITSQTSAFVLSQMNTSEKITAIQKGDTLYKNEKFIYYYSMRKDETISFQEIAYDTIGRKVVFLGADSIQTNTDRRTEMQRVKGSPEFQSFTPRYQVMFKVDPIISPIFHQSGKKHKKHYKGDWYLKPEDLNIGDGKLSYH